MAENTVHTLVIHRAPIYKTEPDTDTWPHGEMIDMAKSPEVIAGELDAGKQAGVEKPTVPQYPWGLAISLRDEDLEKLGFDGDLPDVGDIFEFYATAKVTGASMTEKIDPSSGQATKCCCVELQIVGMLPHGVEPQDVDRQEEEEARSERRIRFYGGDGTSLPSYDVD